MSDSTDVLGVAEELPFVDNAFDAVISVAVLEHVRDPFSAAKEITRVLKPGGKLFGYVPFLQPFHGYPNHYYNMTRVDLANLFRDLNVVDQAVYDCHFFNTTIDS
jgi:ubiquinone/menaquinone biosynthesis C-methylase UbiE